MFQGIVIPSFFFKGKNNLKNLALTIQVHHEDPFSLFTINLGKEERLGDFLRLDERPKCTSHTKQTKVEFFLSQIVWFFYEKSKGKKTRGHLIFEEI
jgi:hypothetical protein